MTHRLPDIYDAPMRFRPERWFNINPSPYEYLSFSAARDAVPDPGSELIKKVALVAILTRYRLELDRRARLDWRFAGITMPKGGVWSDSWIGIVSHKRSPLGARFSISSKGRRWHDRAK
jgi:cytochrome P450